MKSLDPIFLIVDLFCGFGGTTTGFVQAEINGNKIAKVIACVNHDPKAIKSHWMNHKDVKHFEEDIRTLDLTELVSITKHWQLFYPNAYLILWSSLECTNFSKAKGGQARDADSRTLAEHLGRYIRAINPDYIQIENVVEFMSWGPLDDNGKPVSRKNGTDWLRWRNEINALGYRDEWKELNAANFGAYTSRNRLFGTFAKPHLPISWPHATHSKTPSKLGMYGDLKKWKAVKEVLDFTDEGKSIFNRDKDLSEKTLERIYAGLIKFVALGDTSFLSNYKSGHPSSKNSSIDNPLGALTTVPTQAVVQAEFILKYNSMSANGVHNAPSVNEPCPTIACQGRLGIVQTEFLQHYYGNGFTTSTNDPCPTLTTKERCALMQPKFFIDRQFKSITQSSIDDIAGTITTVPKLSLVEASPFIMPTAYTNKPKSIEEPCPTLTASRHHHYIINPAWGGNPGSTDLPCCTIVARQDKAPLSVATVYAIGEKVMIVMNENDSPTMILIKQFMAHFHIIDIKMRMLRVLELLKIQGFPVTYQMAGNQTDHKKFIGNSVSPPVPKAMAECLGQTLLDLLIQKAA